MYKRKEVERLTGNEEFLNTGNNKISVRDFWQYAYSNLNSNVTRGALAEFLLEASLKDLNEIKIRNPWGDYDVEHLDKTIEVKCCAYIQDWDQDKLTKIQWTGLKATELFWNNAVATRTTEKKKDYKAQYYILALLDHQETETLNILDLNQWKFFVLTKNELKSISNDGISVSLVKIQKSGIRPVLFSELKDKLSA
ncbi:hypothetical protein COB80_00330 [Candidatus Kaiserbacteria bacterium]|nr:MAG: hypothetical protein COB80_00330 [Candidatus Kaiserbacteria bacterium]